MKTHLLKKITISLLLTLCISQFIYTKELPKIAIITCDLNGGIMENMLVNELKATGRFDSVGIWNASEVVNEGVEPGYQPSIDEMMIFDAILLTTNGNFIDPVALGNGFAKYAKAGKGVILTGFTLDNASGFNTFLQGEWSEGDWDIVKYHELSYYMDFENCELGIGTIYEPDSPILKNIDDNPITFSQFNIFLNQNPPLADQAIRVLDTENGHPLIYRHNDIPNRLDLGCSAYNAIDCGYDGFMTGGTNLIANCFEYVSGMGNSISQSNTTSDNNTISKVWPNPANSVVNIEYNITNTHTQPIEISITDCQGKIIKNLTNDTQKGIHSLQLNTADLNKGVYFIQLKSNNKIQTKKLVVE